ncbi:MAG: translation initiation factor IF-2 subunit beta [Candidatus Aenigmatarchaeota archaeon]|nr:MAG: translation initiation factor IF-2 subunit beta [Candidatus Aenigmarchaeota archaeon]
MDYEKLLKRGMEKVPDDVEGGERFRIAKPQIEKAGSKTIITNFLEIAGSLRRDPDDMFKFLLKQLATKGELAGQRATLQGVFTQDQIMKKINLYVGGFVKCPECGKHDTKLVYEKGAELIKCEACGAKSAAGR